MTRQRRELLMACLLELSAILGAALMLLGYRWLPPDAFAGLALLFVFFACPLLAIVVARWLLERHLRALTRAMPLRRAWRGAGPKSPRLTITGCTGSPTSPLKKEPGHLARTHSPRSACR